MKSNKKPEYVSNCVINFKHHYTAEFKNLYTICKSNQEDALDVFFEAYKDNGVDKLECTFYGVSLLTNLEWCYRFVVDYIEPKKLIINNDNYVYKRDDNVRYIVRFSTTIDFLKMLSIYDIVQINIEKDVLVSSDLYTTIRFDNLGVITNIVECDNLVNKKVSWDEIIISDIVDIDKAILRTNSHLYRNYIALTGDKLYSHNDFFLVSKDIERLNNSYYLNYQILKSIKDLKKVLKSYIGYEIPILDESGTDISSNNVYIKIDGTILTWNFNDTHDDAVDNLIDLLNQSKFIKVMKIYQKDWNKLNMLSDYSDDGSRSGDVYFDTSKSVIVVSKEDNNIMLSGECQKSITFSVELSLLQLARKLSGMLEPSLYLDKTCSDKLLVVKGYKMVIIRIGDLSIKQKDLLYPELLKPMPKIEKEFNKSVHINEATLSSINMDDIKIVEEVGVTEDDLLDDGLFSNLLGEIEQSVELSNQLSNEQNPTDNNTGNNTDNNTENVSGSVEQETIQSLTFSDLFSDDDIWG